MKTLTRTTTRKRAKRVRQPECPVCSGDLPDTERELELHRWQDATDGLMKVLSYAKTYRPPVEIPDNYMPVGKAVERVRELCAITQTWVVTSTEQEK